MYNVLGFIPSNTHTHTQPDERRETDIKNHIVDDSILMKYSEFIKLLWQEADG